MSAGTGTFRWTEAYRVNVAELDRQHQDLFDAINELDLALSTGEGDVVIASLLEKLMKYAEDHFAAEEALMEKHGFPGLSTHRAQHKVFRHKIAIFLASHKAHKASVPVSLLLFLREWLKDHLLKTDKQYSAFFNARGVE